MSSNPNPPDSDDEHTWEDDEDALTEEEVKNGRFEEIELDYDDIRHPPDEDDE